jgi:ABC-type spermidine/putrescine transport system permease subunit II
MSGTRRHRITRWILLSPLLAFLALPTLVVVPMAFTPRRYIEFPPSGVSVHSFADLVHDHAWLSAALISLKVALIAVVLAVVCGVAAGVGLHGRTFRGRSLVTAAVISPLILPTVVLAFADFQYFAGHGLVGTVLGIGLAHGVVATPLVFLAVQAGLSGLDDALVRAARSLGAGAVGVFRHVYLPTLVGPILSGAIFAFAFSFDEAVIAIFLQGPGATTLPVKMFNDIQFELTPKIAAVATLLVGLATAVLAVHVAATLSRRRSRANVQPFQLAPAPSIDVAA